MSSAELKLNPIEDARAVIAEQLSESCIALFETYGLQISENTSVDEAFKSSDETQIIGILGASAEGLRTSIAILSPLSVLQSSYPANLDGAREQKLLDWAGELANQLLGRLKNKLLPYGCELTLGVPTVIQGNNLLSILPKKSEVSRHTFTTANQGDIDILLSTLIDAQHFKLTCPNEDTESELMAEGDFLFF